MMQKPIIAELDEQIVSSGRTDSDRYAYSNYFNPLTLNYAGTSTPVLTFYQKQLLQAAVLRNPALAQAAGSDPQFSALMDTNDMPALKEAVATLTAAGGGVESRGTELATEDCGCSGTGVMQRSGAQVPGTKLALDLSVADPRLAAAQASDTLLNLVRSEIGYLFLDRTRIRPTGFAVGEHVYSLSLAPGEELVLEQKTFSKRQTTFEQQDESEQQYDLEMTSTLSTELQEGLEWQNSRNTSSGFQAGGSVGGNIKGVDVGVNLAYSENVADASSRTRTRSVKDSNTSSSRVASRYRTQHKITFQLSTEERFESTSKRVVKNPNRFTPISLHYFKILQTLQLTQERFGARLCWAPAIKDPGFDLFQRIRDGRAAILRRVEEVPVPARPVEPVKPDLPAAWNESGEVEANDWGLTCDMSADYDIEIPTPVDGYVWDGDRDRVRHSVVVRAEGVKRGWGWHVVGEPWSEGDRVKIKVHVGVDWKVFGGCGRIYIRAGANFLPGPTVDDPEYREAYKVWQQEMKTWSAKVAELREGAMRDLRTEADEWEKATLRAVNPIAEMMNRIVQHHFQTESRDEAWEIDFWQQVFDWEAAGYALYPSWWNLQSGVRDPRREPTHFFNASWAKMYIPVRVGFERQALRWIFGKTVDTPQAPETEAAFDRVEADLRQYRLDTFGHPDEAPAPGPDGTVQARVLSLGTWTEKLPTDGTHIEVVQSMSTAADPFSRAEMRAANRMSSALLAEKQREVALLAEQVEAARQEAAAAAQQVEALKQEVELRKREVAVAEREVQLSDHEVEAARQEVELLKQEVETARREVQAADHGVALAAQEVELRKQDVQLRARDVALRQELVQSAHHDLDIKHRAAELIKGSIGVNLQIATLTGDED
jgi:hypothetical protein